MLLPISVKEKGLLSPNIGRANKASATASGEATPASALSKYSDAQGAGEAGENQLFKFFKGLNKG